MNSFRSSLTGFILFLLGLTAVSASNTVNPSAPGPDEALQRLVDGNHRFATGTAQHPDSSAERRTEVAAGQHPIAIVLCCADSRVGPEVVFDQGLGDIFVLRNAGNILDDHTIGSIEYAVEHLAAPLIIVVGHERCGAVTAAVNGGKAPGHIHSIVDAITPAIASAKSEAGDTVDNSVRANARYVAGLLRRIGPIVGEAVQAGKVKVVAARYDLDSGIVEVLK